jgi:hypothetical protein
MEMEEDVDVETNVVACARGVWKSDATDDDDDGDDDEENDPKLPIFQINKKLVTKTTKERRILCCH